MHCHTAASFSSESLTTLVSKCTIFPSQNSTSEDLKLSVSDLPMLSCYYIQKGCLFTRPPFPISELISLLKRSLSDTLTHFPPLAGRLITDSYGYTYITCNDAGVDFVHANASLVHIRDILGSIDVPEQVNKFFLFDRAVNYEGHFKSLLAVQVTELGDGVFIGCTINHAVADGTSFWNFFNTFADMSRGVKRISRTPDFSRESVLVSSAVLNLPPRGPKAAFSLDAPLRERIFSFSRESIRKLKAKANNRGWDASGGIDVVELMAEQRNDPFKIFNGPQISSFQALCALIWRVVTRARKLPDYKTTTFLMTANCRHRLEPSLDPLYFGNAIQSILTYASAADVLSRDLRWCAEQLNKNVRAHDNSSVRRLVENWEPGPPLLLAGEF